MPKKIFLGQSSHFTVMDIFSHLFHVGTKRDVENLKNYLAKKYSVKQEQIILTKNGRTALAMALKHALPKKSEVIINGFTCYAVVEAIRAANMEPIFADINKDTLHFDVNILKKTLKLHPEAKAIIVQNTLGILVDIESIEDFAKQHGLKIIEDLAHCAKMTYNNGRETGTIGEAAALSFGKEKSIDSVVGGALIINNTLLSPIKAPSISPNFASLFRARFYPLFALIYRKLAYIKLETPWMAFLIKTHQVERSANSKLNPNERIPKFVTKTALKQFKKTRKQEQPLRIFYLVKDRDEVLKKLKKNGYYLDNFWFETPIAPKRFYKRVNFPENECRNAVEVAKTIINLPTHYSKKDLNKAIEIIKEFTI